eukprot:1387115-Amorphochlora_amoeboformis.AAC.2
MSDFPRDPACRLSNDFAHADDDLGVRAYPYMHSTGGSTDNRFLIRGGWSSQGLNAPTRVDYGAVYQILQASVGNQILHASVPYFAYQAKAFQTMTTS